MFLNGYLTLKWTDKPGILSVWFQDFQQKVESFEPSSTKVQESINLI